MGKGAGNTCDLLPVPLLLLFVTDSITEVTLHCLVLKLLAGKGVLGRNHIHHPALGPACLLPSWGPAAWGSCARDVTLPIFPVLSEVPGKMPFILPQNVFVGSLCPLRAGGLSQGCVVTCDSRRRTWASCLLFHSADQQFIPYQARKRVLVPPD